MLDVEEYSVSSAKVYLIDRSIEGSHGIIASYLVVGSRGEAAVIDPGPSRGHESLADTIFHLLGDKGRLKYILLTHIHLDHGGGAGDLLEYFPNASIYVHPRGAPHLIDPSKLWKASLEILGDTARLYGEPKPVDKGSLHIPRDEESISLDGAAITVLYTPGHASHHMSYILGDTVFAGDSAGTFQCSTLYPTTPFPFKLVDAISSIERMQSLKPRRIAYAHFGIHEPASELLSLYRQLLLDLAELIWRLMREGVGVEELASHVDMATGMVSGYKECMRSRGAEYIADQIEQSLQGIYRFLERFGPQHRGVAR